jgi:hypothetical protein
VLVDPFDGGAHGEELLASFRRQPQAIGAAIVGTWAAGDEALPEKAVDHLGEGGAIDARVRQLPDVP